MSTLRASTYATQPRANPTLTSTPGHTVPPSKRHVALPCRHLCVTHPNTSIALCVMGCIWSLRHLNYDCERSQWDRMRRSKVVMEMAYLGFDLSTVPLLPLPPDAPGVRDLVPPPAACTYTISEDYLSSRKLTCLCYLPSNNYTFPKFLYLKILGEKPFSFSFQGPSKHGAQYPVLDMSCTR